MIAAQGGDPAAYARVLRTCIEIIESVLAARGIYADDALMRQCLATIHAARHTFDPKRSFVAWAEAIACRHGLRTSNVRRLIEILSPRAARKPVVSGCAEAE